MFCVGKVGEELVTILSETLKVSTIVNCFFEKSFI